MDSIQEAFLMLDMSQNLKDLQLFQKYALLYHAINLYKGFRCTGFQEDDPKLESSEGILKLPEDWPHQNCEVVSFRYDHPAKGEAGEEFYFKFLQAGETLEINALSSKSNNEIFSSELRLTDLRMEQFDNLDQWVPNTLFTKYEKDILSKLVKEKKDPKAEEKKQAYNDPFPIGGPASRGGGIRPNPHLRPHIIGDPPYPGQSPLFIPPSLRPPGTSGPGGNLVGPGSSIFYPHGGQLPDQGIDPALGGGMPFFGGDDPNDLYPNFPDPNNPFGRKPNNRGGGGFGPPSFGPGGFNPNNPFGSGGGFGGGGFGGGGFYS